jgi:tetratricopeptide (TPR) repeat protein
MISKWRIVALAGVPVMAVVLGGAVSRGAQGAVLLAMGLIMLVFPVRLAPPRWLWMLALGLGAWLLTAFLPAGAMGESWRGALAAAGGPGLGPWRTAQPWLTLEGVALAAAVLAWVVYVGCQPLDDRHRALWLKVHVSGLGVVALLALVVHFGQVPLPLWPETRFGPFPNRNQTANVFALAGVLAFALGMRQLRHERRNGLIWLGLLGLFLAAVLVNGSRAGLVLLFGGCGAWLVWDGWGARKKSWVALGLSGALVALAAALLFGGEALERTLTTLRSADQWGDDVRWKIQRDALGLVADHPVFGVGVGNFDGVFSFYREHFRNTARPIHPESDWVWLASEAGLPGVILVLALLICWGKSVWPREGEKDRRLRRGALIAAGLFALHGCIDVPGHRLGSMLTALALVPLAWPPRPLIPCGLGTRLRMAGAGVLVAALGAWFLAQALGKIEVPGLVRKDKLLREAETYDRAALHYDAINAAAEGMVLAPLDWRFYFYSARARLRLNIGWTQAEREFRRSRLLEPDSPFVVYQEGALWVGRRPDLALNAWEETLRRSEHRTSHFRQMLGDARRDADLLPRLEVLVERYPELDFFFLRSAPDAVFHQRLAALLATTPEAVGFTPGDAGEFFGTWKERRGNGAFVRELAQHPAWEAVGWWWAAVALAEERDWSGAFALTDRHLPRPVMPGVPVDLSRAREMVKRYPDDLAAGYALAAAASQAGDWPTAVERLEKLSKLPEAPAYFHFLQSEALRKLGREAEAWQALTRYHLESEKR